MASDTTQQTDIETKTRDDKWDAKWDPSFVEQAERFFMCGFTKKQAAAYFGVSTSTISNWISEHPDFAMAYRRGALVADTEVAASLHKRAVGYEATEQHISTETIGGQKKTKVKTITKEVAPDVQAQRWWLGNRQRALWPGTQKIVTDDGHGGDAPIGVTSPETLVSAVRQLMADDSSDNEQVDNEQ